MTAQSFPYTGTQTRDWYSRETSDGDSVEEPAATSFNCPPRPDGALSATAFATLVPTGHVAEVRLPKTHKAGPQRFYGVTSGYFDNPASVAQALGVVTGADAEGVYMTINPVNPDLLARAHNRLKDRMSATTADELVVAYRYIFIDVDPVYAGGISGISATEDERAGAIGKRDQVRGFLESDLGWPQPHYVGSSGNGGVILYRFDAPNTDETKTDVRRALEALDSLLSDDHGRIDPGTYNPAQMMKVPGTVSAKGDHLPNRPHRVATGDILPEPVPVTAKQVRRLADLAPVPPTPKDTSSAQPNNRRTWDIRDVLRDSGITFTEKQRGWSTVFELDRCLTSDDHTDGACVIEWPDGMLLYVCHHARCQGKTWHDAKVELRIPNAAPSDYDRGEHADEAATESPRPGTSANVDTWPAPLAPEALYGLAGDIVRAIEPHTEGDQAAILINVLVMFGNAVGRGPHCLVSGRKHHANEFAILVGDTSKGRKGSSHDYPLNFVAGADPAWRTCVQGGLSSGEGLIWAIRDPIEGMKKGVVEIVDPGVDDKRLVAVEEEYASVCKVATRDGNTVTETLRRAWDGQALGGMTKTNPSRCAEPHVSMLGHVTRDELLRVMDSSAAANGFGNRNLWISVKRSKLLPEGGALSAEEMSPFVERTRQALAGARRAGQVVRDEAAKALWVYIYEVLSTAGTGLFGAMTDRGEAHVLRLSLIYALLDAGEAAQGAKIMIQPQHLLAALAVWEYASASAKHIFGDALGDQVADRILAALRQNGQMDQTEINDLLGRNVSAARIAKALELLLAGGRAKARTQSPATGKGRPRTIWSPT